MPTERVNDQHPAILLVADDPARVENVRRWLEDDYQISTALTGANANNALRSGIDVVILDTQRPLTKGEPFLHAIQNQEVACRIALVTADIDHGTAVLELGFDDFVTKPVSRDELVTLVELLLTRKHYSETVQQYFRLVSKEIAFEQAHDSPNEHPEYQSLAREVDEVRTALDGLVERLTTTDLTAEFHHLNPTREPPQIEGRDGTR